MFGGKVKQCVYQLCADALTLSGLCDASAWAVCLLADLRRYGDHDVAVGRLVAAHSGPARPLLWHDRGYWRINNAGLVSDDLSVTE